MAKETPRGPEREPADLPPEVAPFLREVVSDSLLRYEVLYFFYQNPYAILTITDLSTWMSREERPLSSALQQLATIGYLAQSFASSAYILTTDRDKRRRLEEFFDYLADHPDMTRQLRARLRGGVEAD